MTGLYRDNAVVIRSWKLGEADRILSLMTQSNGKIRCVAKGVRKTQSRFGSRVEPTNHLQVQLYRGKGDLDTLTQVETIDRFPTLREDLERFARASSILEVVDHVAQDREPPFFFYSIAISQTRRASTRPEPTQPWLDTPRADTAVARHAQSRQSRGSTRREPTPPCADTAVRRHRRALTPPCTDTAVSRHRRAPTPPSLDTQVEWGGQHTLTPQ